MTARVPDYAHYLTGWRAWNLSVDREVDPPVALVPMVTSPAFAWLPKQITTAVCVSHGSERDEDRCPSCGAQVHQPPMLGCECGLWAYKTQAAFEINFQWADADVIGEVALWGKVIEHRYGWRAQYAYPLRLWSDVPEAAQLAAFEVPVGPRAEGPQFAPKPNPDALFGPNPFLAYLQSTAFLPLGPARHTVLFGIGGASAPAPPSSWMGVTQVLGAPWSRMWEGVDPDDSLIAMPTDEELVHYAPDPSRIKIETVSLRTLAGTIRGAWRRR